MSGGAAIWAVVTCMGRLDFIRRTAHTVLHEREMRYCLVDYSCPQHCGAWLSKEFAGLVAQGRAAVARSGQRPYFEKSRAQNLGAALALQHGAQYLCFLDADTLARPGFGGWLADNVRPDRFVIAAPMPTGREVHSLMGLLVVPAAKLKATGGYDEGMLGWGGEDIELRLRLHVKERMPYDRMPLKYLGYLDHGDELRDKNHVMPMAESGKRNLQRAYARLREWSGREFHELPLEARQLTCAPPRPPGAGARRPALIRRPGPG